MTDRDDEEDEIEDEDPNNAGSHINDAFNRRDSYGRVIVNIGHPSEDPDIYLAPQVARVIKPHQVSADEMSLTETYFEGTPSLGQN